MLCICFFFAFGYFLIREVPGRLRRATRPALFTISEHQSKEINEFYGVQECCATNFEASKL